MRKADLNLICNQFHKDLSALQDRLDRIDELVKAEASRQLPGTAKPEEDRTWLYEAACLWLYSRWEAFTLDVMAACLNRDFSKLREQISKDLPKHLTLETCEALLTWRAPFPTAPDKLKGFAREVLAGSPFDRINNTKWQSLGLLHAARNALAHPSSTQARRRFREKVGQNRDPGQYLKARIKDRPRLIELIKDLQYAAQAIRDGGRAFGSGDTDRTQGD